MKSGPELISPDYGQWVAELKKRYRAAQIKAAVAVNRELLRFYWGLGRDIVVRFEKDAGYGTGFFDRLSADLARAIPEARGFSPVNLRYCRRFWRLYAGAENLPQVVEESSGENLQQLVEELAGVPWGHLAQHRRTRSRPFRWGPMGTKEVLATKNAKDAKGTRKRENSGREAGVVSEERTGWREGGGREGFHGVENMLPLCGKVAETCFHCVENFAKHGSIVWKNPRNLLPLCGKTAEAGGGWAMAVDCCRWQSIAVEGGWKNGF